MGCFLQEKNALSWHVFPSWILNFLLALFPIRNMPYLHLCISKMDLFPLAADLVCLLQVINPPPQGSFVLVIAELLGSVGLQFSFNLENICPLFLKTFFSVCTSIPPDQELQTRVCQAASGHLAAHFFSLFLRQFPPLCLRGHWSFLMQCLICHWFHTTYVLFRIVQF